MDGGGLDGGGFWDINVNGHYLIKLPTPKLAVYPLAGLSIVGFGGSGGGSGSGGDVYWEYQNPITGEWIREYSDYEDDEGDDGSSSTFLGFNLGGGVQYELKPNILLQGELKYRIGEVWIRGFGISVGVAYKF